MTNPTVPTCRTCGAEIIWAYMQSGKRMPLDAKPITGLFHVVDGHAFSILERCHVSHFATCPDADQHRKEQE